MLFVWVSLAAANGLCAAAKSGQSVSLLKELMMSYFDTPIGRCEVMQIMVVTDQTEQECALDNGCPAGSQCSLAGCLAPARASEGVPHAAARSLLAA
jgi:hypothetical protein